MHQRSWQLGDPSLRSRSRSFQSPAQIEHLCRMLTFDESSQAEPSHAKPWLANAKPMPLSVEKLSLSSSELFTPKQSHFCLSSWQTFNCLYGLAICGIPACTQISCHCVMKTGVALLRCHASRIISSCSKPQSHDTQFFHSLPRFCTRYTLKHGHEVPKGATAKGDKVLSSLLLCILLDCMTAMKQRDDNLRGFSLHRSDIKL